MTQNWEYRVLASGTDPTEIEEQCNEVGKRGGELVSTVLVEATPGEWRLRLIFKFPA